MPRPSQRPRVLTALRTGQLRLERRLVDRWSRVAFADAQQFERLPVVVVGHESLLLRRLGDTAPALQDAKVQNLRIAIRSVDGLLLRPGETFSFRRRLGRPSASRGYRDGLVLRGGRPGTGMGGCLCQLANLLHWMALHAPLEVVERHHQLFEAGTASSARPRESSAATGSGGDASTARRAPCSTRSGSCGTLARRAPRGRRAPQARWEPAARGGRRSDARGWALNGR